ncbi:MAG: transglycosylase domain-containing protein [Candidatus Daviesbacteria bacterium]|nr:transglycosylase domain-containing protein [Candidatus Daviesbacteria bacterium]
MPRGRKKTSFNSSPLHITLLLVKIVLIKIGNTPLRMLQFIIYNLQCTIRFLPKILHSTFYILHFARHNRARGRPKKFRLSPKIKIGLAVALFAAFVFSYTFFILAAAYQLPTPTKLTAPNKSLTTEFYDRNGILLYRFYEGSNRTLINLSDIPEELIQATIAIEDQNYYHHIGIDLPAILRALHKNITTGSQEGASTITQQLIKNSLLTPERTYARKIREIALALWTERIYSKEKILQMYFNEASYGGVNVGIGAAARTYFGKIPKELNLAESAYLAGLPASPTQFSPYGSRPELAKLRQKQVLDRMVKEKYITKKQADQAFTQKLNIKPLANNILAPHFVFYVRDILIERFGARVVSQGGLKVYTTLDLGIQEKAEGIVRSEVDNLKAFNVTNGAAMVTDSQTGQILAMVGSRDYHYPGFGNFNAALALRQPGSSVKPITYAVALSKGYNPGSILLDTPVAFKDEWGNTYAPVNYDGRYRGPITLRQALASSINTTAVKMLLAVGIDEFAKTARDLGITTIDNPERFGLSLTLGSAEVKMIEMMGMYGTFASNGLYREPTGILKVTNSEGQTLEEFRDHPRQAISPDIAYTITNILADDDARKLAFGPKSLLHIPGYEVGVKTGTSNLIKDNVTYGYTPKYVVGAWVGNADSSPANGLTSGITGAAPIWNKIIHELLDGTEPLAFQRPDGLADTAAPGKKELELTKIVPKEMVRIKKDKDKIIFQDKYSTYATSAAQPDQQANQATPTLPSL